MRKLFMVVAAAAALAVPGVAAASPEDYGTQPGFEVAKAVACNSGHGSFGYFGGDYNLGDFGGTPYYPDVNAPFAVGQDLGATGSNNSTAANTCRTAA
jgi:hypothetical protein